MFFVDFFHALQDPVAFDALEEALYQFVTNTEQIEDDCVEDIKNGRDVNTNQQTLDKLASGRKLLDIVTVVRCAQAET